MVKGGLDHVSRKTEFAKSRFTATMEITIQEEKISHFTFDGKKKGRSRVTKIPFTTLLIAADSSQVISMKTMVSRSCCGAKEALVGGQTIFHTFSDARFKKVFRVWRGTFLFILGHIRHDLLLEIQFAGNPFLPNVALLSA